MSDELEQINCGYPIPPKKSIKERIVDAWCRMLCKLGAHTNPKKTEMGAQDRDYHGPRVYRITCGKCGAWLANCHEDIIADRSGDGPYRMQ